MEKLYALDLFSGIGGNTLGLNDYIRTIAYCEFERHAQGVLLSRMRSGDIKPAPIWDDVRTLGKAQFATPVDIVLGGFPCQDISVAGKGAGITPQTRSGLFYEILRLVNELKPPLIFLENVPAIRTRGLNVVLYELTQAGYDCRWTMLSAASIGAVHKRERWFLLAHANGNALQQQYRRSSGAYRQDPLQSQLNGSEEFMADSDCKPKNLRQSKGWQSNLLFNGDGDTQSLADAFGSGLEGQREVSSGVGQKNQNLSILGGWSSEPDVGRVAHGVPLRVDRLKRLGNSVVPAQAKAAFEILMGLVWRGVRDKSSIEQFFWKNF
jgi:DNA (cytosine-5)-methyltransferase 1